MVKSSGPIPGKETDSRVERVGDLYGFDGVGDDDRWQEGVSRFVLPVGIQRQR